MQSFELPALVVSPDSCNITDLLVDRARKTPNLPLFAKDSPTGYISVTSAEFLDEVQQIAKGLIASGIQQSQAVAIMSRTRYEWTALDFAIWFAGAVSVPIYETSSASQMEWILSNSDSVALFAETPSTSKDLSRSRQRFP